MIGFKSHSDDTQSSRPKKAHDNPVYRSLYGTASRIGFFCHLYEMPTIRTSDENGVSRYLTCMVSRFPVSAALPIRGARSPNCF